MASIPVQLLPEGLTRELGEQFTTLPAEPSPDELKSVLLSDTAREVMGQVRADIATLDSFFDVSGPGGFYMAKAATGPAGKLHVHVFAPAEVCQGDAGPHSHNSEVISAVHGGSVVNTEYDFVPDPDGDIRSYVTPTYRRPGMDDVFGRLVARSAESIEDSAYEIPHGTIHTSATLGDMALTLCYLGNLVTPALRYNHRDAPDSLVVPKTITPRPQDLLG